MTCLGIRTSPRHNRGCKSHRFQQKGVDRPVRNLFEAGKLLLLDMASTVFFLTFFLVTKNIPLSVIHRPSPWTWFQTSRSCTASFGQG
ncbi:hypothetical protein SAMN05444158_7255 [Bradyrhizobium canariense]|uniref:Uncharacterized protein n=1 Tax=Bradyrhizobium canariense TaxID=255045 RepID=A0A1H2BKZ7_9BRAD|nr:hypothetical protein SAMN05444158_7255 [Bradyrhizobium canariense]